MSAARYDVVLDILGLLTEPALGEVLRGAPRILAAAADAKVASLVIAQGEETGVEYWHGADERLRERLRPLVLAERGAGEVRTRTLDGPEPATLRTSPLRSGEGLLGVVALVLEGPAGEAETGVEVADRFAAAVAARLSRDRRLASTQAALARVRRWFETMDAQVRILDRERQKLSAVVGQSDTPMFAADRGGAILWANAALKDALAAHAVDRVVGLQVQELWDLLGAEVPPAGSPGCPIRRTFEGGAVVHLEPEGRLDGEVRSLYVTCLPIKAPDGQTAEVLAMIQDLSDLEVLRRSEARYRLLFERSPNAMIMAEPGSGQILLANPSATALTGRERAELVSLALEALHEPADWHAASAEYARAVDEGSVSCTERRLIGRSGDLIIADVIATRFDLDGDPVTLLELADVTEKRRLEEELRHSQKMEALGQLAGGVAHEFNNIVTVILGQAELLKIHPSLDERLREIADETQKTAMRAAYLTRKLLAFSRKEVLNPELLDANEVVRNVEGLVRTLVGERIAVNVELAPSPCTVRTDRWELEQIVINLAANARDAMPRGGELRLALSRVEPAEGGSAGEVVLTVRDDGVGMGPETLERLYEPFFTTKPPGAGTGLGLATVKQIVDRNGGTLGVESELGAGTAFRIALPLVAATRLRQRDVVAAPREGAAAGGGERLLVVDDAGEVRRMAARLLALDGYSVVVAASGEEALALCEEAPSPFDLVLTDVVMPDMTGVELARRLRSRCGEMRVLYMSGYKAEEVAGQGADISGEPFLSKPFTRQALSQMVRRALDR